MSSFSYNTFFQDSVSFIEQIRLSVPLATQLLGSKVSSDVHEALEFLATSKEFELPGAKEGVRKSLLLMSSSEEAIRDLVLNIYVRLYFSPSGDSPQASHSIVASNLLSLVRGANIGELASLEEMLLSMMKTKRLPKTVVRIFWDIFAGRVSWAKPKDMEYSLIILSMVAKADKNILLQNLPLLLAHGFKPSNLIVARYSCQALHCLADRSAQNRFPSTHPLFSQLTETLVSSVTNDQTSQWIPFAEQAATTIYMLAEQPNVIAEHILSDICDKVFAEDHNTSAAAQSSSCGNSVVDPLLLLARLLGLAGQVALQQMVFLEADVRSELKRRRQSQETEEEATKQKEEVRSYKLLFD